MKSTASDAHITLARGVFSPDMVGRARAEVARISKDFEPFEVVWEKLTNEERPPTKEHPYAHCWIALIFNDSKLYKLSNALDKWLVQEKLSDTFNYVEEVKGAVTSSRVRSVVADHMNICNYCLLERADEVCSLILNKIPKRFLIEKVAFRRMDGTHAWELAL